MTRKSKTINQKLSEKQAELDNIKRMAEIAEKEEKDTLEKARQQIQAICDAKDLFCGMILTPADITAIVDLALKSRENIKIPFTLYFSDSLNLEP